MDLLTLGGNHGVSRDGSLSASTLLVGKSHVINTLAGAIKAAKIWQKLTNIIPKFII